MGEPDVPANSIPERFDHLVRLHPDRIAITDGRESLSYQELGRLAGRYAAALPGIDSCRDELGARAALLLDHGTPVLAGALAALRSGFTVVVLNPHDPPERHRRMQRAAEASVLLTDVGHLDHARAAGFKNQETVVVSAARDENAEPSWPGPDDLAFLISTSGTTGRQKMAMQTHRNLLHGAMRNGRALGIVNEDRIAWLAPLSGAHGLSTVWMALMNGATLCPFPIASQGLIGLRDRLIASDVTVFDSSPSVLRNFSRTLGGEAIPGIRLVRLTAEPALRSDFDCFRRHFPSDAVLATMLGSSETGTISVGMFSQKDDPPGPVLNVGIEPEGIRLLLVDEDGAEATGSEVGEVVVESRYLSPGYWQEPELTAERFEGEGHTRRFYTHDLGQRSESGALTLLGRVDSQVKIRGHRLQPEEVEGVLAAQPGVAAAAVAVRATLRGDSTLTGYVMPSPGSTLDIEALRRALSTVLPPHAVPASWVCVDALPVTPNGKIDRARLAELDPAPGRPVPALTALNGVEGFLLSLWEELLERPHIGLADDFFSIGGDSLAAMEMLAAIEDRFGCSLTPAAVLEAPTIEALARLIAGEARSAAVVAPRAGLAEEAGRPPLFLAPGLGQSGLRFRLLAETMGTAFSLRTLEVPWWDGRPSRIRTVEQLAAFHLRQIQDYQSDGPYLIGGSSFGGRVALEIARQLAAAGREVALLVVFDSLIGLNEEWNSSALRQLAARTRWRLSQRGFGAVNQSLRAAYVGHRTAAVIRGARPAPYDGPVVLFRCTGSPSPTPDRGWGPIARGGLEIHDLDCKHDEQFEEPFVDGFAAELAGVLSSAYAKAGVGVSTPDSESSVAAGSGSFSSA